MAVLNKKMEMPYSCLECPFKTVGESSLTMNEEYYRYTIYKCVYCPDDVNDDDWMTFRECNKGRRPYCPLEEVKE